MPTGVYHRTKMSPEERLSRSAACNRRRRAKDPVRARELDRKWRANNPDKRRRQVQESGWRGMLNPDGTRFKMKDFDKMSADQSHVCNHCGNPPKKDRKIRVLCVDHDHTTMVVRQLLCSGCNGGYGKIGDNAEGFLRGLVNLCGSKKSALEYVQAACA